MTRSTRFRIFGGQALLVAIVAVAVVAALGAQPAMRDLPLLSVFTHRVGAPEVRTEPRAIDPADRPSVRLAVAGDVGTGDDHERRTAAVVAGRGSAQSFDALVLLGDNVYPSGDPARLDDTVFRPFRRTIRRGAHLVAALGNHDVRDGNGPGQVRALGMPGQWYRQRVGPVEIIVLNSTDPENPAQRAWLERALAAPAAPWRVVALHHPLYSAGRHGSEPGVRAAFGQLFERHGVDLVLAGHDHDYQRSVPIRGVVHVVSGGAAKLRKTGREEFTAYSASTRHFVEINAWPDRLAITAIDQDGLAFDDHVLVKRKEPIAHDRAAPQATLTP